MDLFSAMGFEVGKNRRRLQPNTLSAYNILVIAGARLTDIANSVTISPDGRTIASGGAKQTIKFWNLEIGQELKILKNGAWVGQLRFAPDGRTLAASGADGTISLWDVVTGRVQRLLARPVGPARSLAFSPDGATLAAGRDNGDIELWDVATGELRTVLKAHDGLIYSVAFSPDGRLLASGGTDKEIKLWHLANGILRTTLRRQSGGISCMAFSPNGKTLAVAGDSNTIDLWDIDRQQLNKSLEGHRGTVYSLAFAPDDRRLASGSTTDKIIIWDIEDGQTEHVLDEHEDWVVSLAFSPDGKRLASVDDDERIKVWDVVNGKLQLELTGRDDFRWNPDPAFTGEECDAVVEWVHSGGGLLLLVDHAPWGATAASLASRFGVTLSNSKGTVDPLHYDPDGNEFSLVFSRRHALLGDHPITRGRNPAERIDRVVTYCGSSFTGPNGSTSLLNLSPTAVDVFQHNRRVPATGRSQGVAVKYGDGRIVVLGEMGMFMANAVYLDGSDRKIGLSRKDCDNRQLAINIVHWLSKRIK